MLIVWPDTNELPLEVAKILKTNNHLIICGPPGVTGSNSFYDYLDENFEMRNQQLTCSFAGGEADTLHVIEKLKEPKNNQQDYFKSLRNKFKIKIRKPKV